MAEQDAQPQEPQAQIEGVTSPEGSRSEAEQVAVLFEHRFGEAWRNSQLSPQSGTAEDKTRIFGEIAAFEQVLREVFLFKPAQIQEIKDRVFRQYPGS